MGQNRNQGLRQIHAFPALDTAFKTPNYWFKTNGFQIKLASLSVYGDRLYVCTWYL